MTYTFDMPHATIIYPHQLFAESPALTAAKTGSWPVYLVEESLVLTFNPIHRQKLVFHKLSLDAYEAYLTKSGHIVIRLTIHEYPTTTDVFKRLIQDGVKQLHVVDPTDTYLERAIAKSGIERVFYESPLFLLPKQEAVERYQKSKRFMATFYKQLRQKFNILMDDDGTPIGGQWSFDADNRQKLPKHHPLPSDLILNTNPDIDAAIEWTKTVPAEQYGMAGCWLPYTHEEAQKFLTEFLRIRLTDFGPYEDAMTTRGVRLFHSALSPLMNVGLLSPRHIIDTTLAYAKKHDVPLQSLEGFIRQIIGWREFIRASYESDGSAMRSQNFFKHTRPIPDTLWTGTTGITPVDHVVSTALRYGYTHHIERLMVMGNFFLLTETHPTEVYRWFMAMYVDAYDWVMVPNVYGMSQFADGGSFATKPYISGASYIKKMSDYPSGDWEATWTALYWHFINMHKEFFSSNHRLSMMPRLLDKMSPAVRTAHLDAAKEYLNKH